MSCFFNYTRIYHSRSIHTPSREKIDESFAFYKISFQWYAFIGVAAMIIPSIIVSHLSGGQDFTRFDIQLLSPCIRKLLPKKYQHTELKSLQKENAESSALETTKWIFLKEDREDSSLKGAHHEQ